MKKIKLLIVDDSVLFRSQIQLALKDCPNIEIVGAASNGKIAIDKMACQDIDVCTLDIEMPVMDGIETLKEMKARGIKTQAIMFSSQSRAGAEKTISAMRIGAIDFVAKPIPDDSRLEPHEKIRETLLPKILSLFGEKNPKPTQIRKATSVFNWDNFLPEVLVIASSTGGPNALVDFFSLLKEPMPFPILIAQHMPPLFTASLAEQLGVVSGKIAREGVHGEVLKANQIYMAPGNFHMIVGGDLINPRIELNQGPQKNYVRPCADYLFESAARVYTSRTMGIVFTGMGRDGGDGAAVIKSKSGGVMIQSEESCVVFGMPGAVHTEGNFDFIGTPSELAKKTIFQSKVKRGFHVA